MLYSSILSKEMLLCTCVKLCFYISLLHYISDCFLAKKNGNSKTFTTVQMAMTERAMEVACDAPRSERKKWAILSSKNGFWDESAV